MFIFIHVFGFTKVQLTERIFILYNFKENRCLWKKDSPHFKTSSVRAAALEKLTTLLDHKTVEQMRTKFHSLRTSFNHEIKKQNSDWKYLKALQFLQEDGCSAACDGSSSKYEENDDKDKWNEEDVDVLIEFFRGKAMDHISKQFVVLFW